MGAIIFCNIAWMNRYQGINEFDKPKNGGSWVEENNDAVEAYNFQPYENMCYGYVEHKGSALNLERLDKTSINADALEDVTVVWVATGEEGRRIVGWYEKAKMYRQLQELDNGSCYYFATKAINAYLIPVEKRDFSVPSASQEGKGRGMGQANVWYADSDFIQRKYIPKVTEYLDSIRTTCRITGAAPEESRTAIDISNESMNYDKAIEAYKKALEYFTDDEQAERIAIKKRLSCVYRMTGKNFLAWHMEEDIFEMFKEDKDKGGMADALLIMMDIAREENAADKLRELIDSFDAIGTEYCADDVEHYRSWLKEQE